MISDVAIKRHKSVQDVVRFLEPNPNLRGKQYDIADEVETLAVAMLRAIKTDSAELTAGLRKLMEAKDCFVRASLEL